jgi:hypothetical protein
MPSAEKFGTLNAVSQATLGVLGKGKEKERREREKK